MTEPTHKREPCERIWAEPQSRWRCAFRPFQQRARGRRGLRAGCQPYPPQVIVETSLLEQSQSLVRAFAGPPRLCLEAAASACVPVECMTLTGAFCPMITLPAGRPRLRPHLQHSPASNPAGESNPRSRIALIATRTRCGTSVPAACSHGATVRGAVPAVPVCSPRLYF